MEVKIDLKKYAISGFYFIK